MRLAAVAAAVLLLAACNRSLPELAPSRIPEPAADDLESVIFLFGDAGYADEQRNPVLRRLALDVELWSGRLAQDSAVVVLFLGDVIYPLGMRSPERPEFARDSAIVQSQVNLLAGPNARRHGSIGYFLAGNHDWGNARDAQGFDRLTRLQAFLDRRRAEGIHVRLQPEAGEPGPAVIDILTHVRLLLFDTAWWLLARSDYLKRRSFQQTEDAIRSTPADRYVIAAAHHPFKTASRHGGLMPFWAGLGVRFLMTRSGAALQDLTSPAYRELTNAMLEAFRAGPPLIFAGGHDHNLQIIDHFEEFPWPRYTVVSGSGSKVSEVGHTKGLLYRNAAPGYARVMTHRSGRVDLFMVAAGDKEWLECTGTGADLERCMTEGLEQFVTRYGMRVR